MGGGREERQNKRARPRACMRGWDAAGAFITKVLAQCTPTCWKRSRALLSPRLVEGRIDDAQLMADRQTQPCIEPDRWETERRQQGGRMPAAFYDSKCNLANSVINGRATHQEQSPGDVERLGGRYIQAPVLCKIIPCIHQPPKSLILTLFL
ncbi:hypothetical protein M431DRAFT_507186 [Trichoderma harzianum CBS 226.95]|uniref:Uncharacterized protein n=1 Tax=Trichoderma harzianum CBS 226.95 TaxID=983964 RepID=A0A2T4AEK7_TRIHA|nr:hypothetical protein M431DRAFT_507186 [Trichoderma harzianum CBS 226.95]PTB55520.1 hypothetical protein M431DRAFT_507186 [Trichoderma harzianum CBS 226.95]